MGKQGLDLPHHGMLTFLDWRGPRVDRMLPVLAYQSPQALHLRTSQTVGEGD